MQGYHRASPLEHLLAIIPMSANLLAKVTGGLCDDLLTSVIRAWDIDSSNPKRATIIAAPSMNSMMWAHPLTAKQIAILNEEWGWFEVLPPQLKTLACGDIGQGGMCDWKEIVTVIEKRLASLIWEPHLRRRHPDNIYVHFWLVWFLLSSPVKAER
jgi:phosphopantothenoylcysteine decarboxylase